MPLDKFLLSDLLLSGTGPTGGLDISDGFVISDSTNANGQFGWSVTGIGDFDGDNVADFMVGAPGTNGSAGALYIVYGEDATANPGPNTPVTGPDLDLGTDFAGPGAAGGFAYTRIDGAFGANGVFDTEGDLLGYAVTEVGDLNGDGVHDIMFSAPGSNGDGFNYDVGDVYVLYGQGGGDPAGRLDVIDVTDIETDPTLGFTMGGFTFGDELGFSLANLGDINGDGFTDIMVGSPGANNGAADTGGAYVIYGRNTVIDPYDADFDLSDIAPDQGFSISGFAGLNAGGKVSAAGDMNNDGFDDFIVVSPDGANGAGEAYLIWGRDFGAGAISNPADGAPFTIDLANVQSENLGVRITGVYNTAGGDRAGTSIASGGDVNGDDIDDLIIGAPRANDGVGGVYILFGQDMSVAEGFAPETSLKYGDMGGATWDAAELYGDDAFWSRDINLGQLQTDFDPLTPERGTLIAGDFDDRQFGHDVYMVGDLDRDGIEDLVIGSPASSDADGGILSGSVYIVRGREDWDFAFPGQTFSPIGSFGTGDGWELVGIDNFDSAGWSVGVVGDFDTEDGVVVHDLNDDDTLDIIIGAPGANGGDGEVYIFYTPITFVEQIWTPGNDDPTDGAVPQHIGTEFNDYIQALGGDDVVLGLGLRDSLDGGDGDDLIYGGSHADTLLGGNGSDRIYGDPDQAAEEALGGPLNAPGYQLNDERDTLFGGAGNDFLYGGTDTDLLFGGDDVDRIFGGAGEDTAFGGDGIDFIRGGADGDTIEGDGGNDRIFGEDDDDTLLGELGNDRIFGGDGADVIEGGAGQDTIEGGIGADTIDGGDARDRIFGGGGLDTIEGGAGADTIFGGGAADTIDGGAARDTIFGGGDNDTISGEGGLDVLRGGGGDDDLFGGGGADDLRGAAGNDELFGGGGADQLRGGMDNDTLFGGGGADFMRGQIGDDTLTGGGGADDMRGGGGVDTLIGNAGADLMYGNGGADSLVGGNGVDEMYGGGGRDTLRGGNQNDRLFGDNGRDRLFGGGGNDEVYGGNGNDVVRGNLGDDILEGGLGNDRLIGDGGLDILRGDDGDDRLQGGGDNDFLFGGAGADDLDGGAGDDELHVDSFDTNIQGGADTDTAIVVGPGGVTLDVTNSIETAFGAGGVDVFDFTGGAAPVLYEGGGGNDTLTGGTGNDSLVGGAGADDLSGGAGDDVLRIDELDLVDGGAGADTAFVDGPAGVNLVVGNSIETAFGAGGDDVFNFSGGGDSVLFDGGAGDDVLTGGNANDSLVGGAGADELYGGDGNDYFRIDEFDTDIEGGLGIDTVEVEPTALAGVNITAPDSIEIGTGTDFADVFSYAAADTNNVTYSGEDGADILRGGAGDDRLFGGDGNDDLRGRNGDDSLFGGDGVDELRGGGGSDTLGGGAGDGDSLFGGGGPDLFILSAGDGNDTIFGVNLNGVDQIEISGFGAALDSFAELSPFISIAGADVLIGTGGGDSILLDNYAANFGFIDATDFIFS